MMHTFSAGCGGDRTKEYGTFGATGYDAYNSNGQRCEWKVQVAQGRNILLTFYYFQLNQEPCDFEKVEVMTIYTTFSVFFLDAVYIIGKI